METGDADETLENDVPALVAEVRRLRGVEDARASCLAYIDTLKRDIDAARDDAAKADSYAATAREEARLWRALAKAESLIGEMSRASGTSWGALSAKRFDQALADRATAITNLRAAGIDPDPA